MSASCDVAFSTRQQQHATMMVAQQQRQQNIAVDDKVDDDDDDDATSRTDKVLGRVFHATHQFYRAHPEIKASHGITHIMKVYHHALKAVDAHRPKLGPVDRMEVLIAALLHDADDHKYFPTHGERLDNARTILEACDVETTSRDHVYDMIHLVSCSKNGNTVPQHISTSGEYFRLIPRWADRLDTVGAAGVVRCYQYNVEHGRPLCSENSPRAVTEAQVWKHATPARFATYMASGGQSEDMISHYYDKLLHVTSPPRDIVRNPYLEEQARASSRELVEMCLRYGRTGVVDTGYVKSIAKENGWRIES